MPLPLPIASAWIFPGKDFIKYGSNCYRMPLPVKPFPEIKSLFFFK